MAQTEVVTRQFNVTDLAPEIECTAGGDILLFANDGSINETAFMQALGVWVGCQSAAPKILDASHAFNADPHVICCAVRDHHWLFLEGDFIHMEGV